MDNKKEFDKYQRFAPDYHYRQIDRRFFKTYNAFVDARFKKVANAVGKIATNKYSPSASSVKILDVGCGDGVLLNLIQKILPDLNLELYGVDQVKEALNVAGTKNPKAHFAQASATNLPFKADSFDIIISSDVIEHIVNPKEMLEEIRRVARTDASIIIGTPIRNTKYPTDHNHVEEFFKEDFMDLMSQYFHDCILHESHSLAVTLLYNAPTKSFLNFKYFINLLSLAFNYNPFLAERHNKSEMFAYMYVTCRK